MKNLNINYSLILFCISEFEIVKNHNEKLIYKYFHALMLTTY